MTTDPGDLILDPTCGSGTTAYVAEQWGRRWITCDTSRVALALARTRLMAAKFPYYLGRLAGRKKALECGGLPPLSNTGEAEEERSVASTLSSSQSPLKRRRAFALQRAGHSPRLRLQAGAARHA